MSALIWAVKGSLVNYILDAAEGTITVEDGATGESIGPFRFPGGESTQLPAVGGAPLAFEGAVHLRGHGGMLDLPLRNLAIEATEKGYVISIDDPDEKGERLNFATIASWTPEGDGLRAVGTALTLDGSDLFFGPYAEGTAFDEPFLDGVSA